MPLFFLVGAGISHPPVPLASHIVDHCRTFALQLGRKTEPSGKDPIDTYSHWFQQAYPQPTQRQRYLRQLIERKPISDSNLRLAHLLLEKKIGNLVVTPNFDTFLSQALLLFGEQPIVCDHPNTVERIDPERDDIQIVHVHGTYWFYDCCNLRGEIEKRSRPSTQTISTMAALLDRLLMRRSPLVIGYGGWDGDVIMTALKRRLQSPLAYNLYWFCHRRSQVESLPLWLRETDQPVHFVVPPLGEPSGSSLEQLTDEEGSGRRQVSRVASAEPKGTADREDPQVLLRSRLVLEKLIRAFDLKAPRLTSDPLGFLEESLGRSLLQEIMDERGGDIYYIRSVIARLKRAKEREKEAIERLENLLEQVRDALRRSQYGDAVVMIGEVEKSDLSHTQLRELMDAAWSAALRIHDNVDSKLDAYDHVILIGDKLSSGTIAVPNVRERVARALVNKGVALGELGRGEEAVTAYDEVVRRFGEATEPGLRDQVARALVNKGIRLGKMGRGEEELAAYDEVVRRFGEATEPGLRERVAGALVNKGITLGELGRGDEELAAYDEVVRRFGEATEPGLREQVRKAQVGIKSPIAKQKKGV